MISLVPIVHLPDSHLQEGADDVDATRSITFKPETVPRGRRARRSNARRFGTHLFLIVMSIIWLIPLAWTLFTSLRPKADTDKYGYFSLGGAFNFDNFVTAWNQGGFATYFCNSVIITVPTVILTLLFASMMAFAVSAGSAGSSTSRC